MIKSTPNYIEAIRKLNTTQTGFKVLRDRIQSKKLLNESALDQMRNWVQCLGYSISDLDRLNVVHVAGTKGKGTTCAYTNSILQQHRLSLGTPQKIGLYTSPHLTTVRERIQINSEPLSEEKFAKYFFEVWDALELEDLNSAIRPSYFRFLTLMSFHVFMQEDVTTAIYEVGVGGELDSTNIIASPAVTGITTLGIDHVTMLGNTIDKIAWHKAGIFKKGCPAFTVPQVSDAMEVLKKRATEKGASLSIVEEYQAVHEIDIKPAEPFQRTNAFLAIKLAETVLKKLGVLTSFRGGELSTLFIQGLEDTLCRGRCQELVMGHEHWYLDGAHTQESLEVACSWFGRRSGISLPRVLIFNQQSSRDAISLLKTVHNTLDKRFGLKLTCAIFCTNSMNRLKPSNIEFMNQNVDPDAIQNLSLQRELAQTWKELNPGDKVICLPSIEAAVDHARAIARENRELKETEIFVTGSFHLVGGLLSILQEGQEI
ncbi:FolC protein [Aspergillus uvarum CBS 121591]|uniref:Folylpolyglutamate synthase n=1 Tax=Aspergillus uvarum CBS 121591 TaxID=1448315 RepID=A0A319BWS0_9EURO|nr:FolC protein [Aspergillus uvarum CBS 121591]PYH76009.1 FolC protein [Aspergillus uvarum CBS 121591]